MFESNPVAGKQRVSHLLKNARLAKDKQLEDIAKELKINKIYLKALEEGDFHRLPSGIYALNYLREYCFFLGLNYKKLASDFKEERARFINDKKGVFDRQVVDKKYFISLPKVIKSSGLALVVLLCLTYLGYLIANIYLPPTLKIITPKENIATTSNKIVVSGISEKESEVFINDLPISINSDGYFEYPVNLKQGVNTIVVTAQKKNKKKQVETREILYKDSQKTSD